MLLDHEMYLRGVGRKSWERGQQRMLSLGRESVGGYKGLLFLAAEQGGKDVRLELLHDPYFPEGSIQD